MTLQAVAEHEYEQAFLRPHDCVTEVGDEYDARRMKAQEVVLETLLLAQGSRKPSKRTNR